MVDRRLMVSYRAVVMYPRLILISGLLFCLCSAAKADSRLLLDAGLGYSCLKDNRRFHGGFSEFGLGWVTDSAVGVRAGYKWAEYRSKGLSARQHTVSLHGVYELDYFHYVPWVSVGALAYLPSGSLGSELMTGVSLEAGINRLLDPSWALGVVSGFSTGPTGNFPGVTSIGLRLSFAPMLHDPFEP